MTDLSSPSSDPVPPHVPISPTTAGVTSAATSTQWPVLCHLSGLAGFIIPFGNIIGPLVVWLTQRGASPEMDRHGKEVLNFHISWMIYMTISGFSVLLLIGFVLAPLVYFSGIILTCIGAFKASEGGFYRYPLTIRFIN